MDANYRRAVHATSILTPLLVELTSKIAAIVALAVISIVYVTSEIARVKGNHRVPLITKFTLMMSRPDERSRFIYRPACLALGIVLALSLFPKDVAYASVAILAVGDPAAAFIGQRFGRTHIGSKTVEGCIGGLVASVLVASVFVQPVIALTGSLAGMVSELSGAAEDNITIPLVAGGSMFLMGLTD